MIQNSDPALVATPAIASGTYDPKSPRRAVGRHPVRAAVKTWWDSFIIEDPRHTVVASLPVVPVNDPVEAAALGDWNGWTVALPALGGPCRQRPRDVDLRFIDDPRT